MKRFLPSSALTLASLVSAAQKIAANPGEARVEVTTLHDSKCSDFTETLAKVGGGLKSISIQLRYPRGESPQ
jgi:hypothetical protein